MKHWAAEFVPRSLCNWGGSDGSGAATGGGDWGSSGSYDASGFDSGFSGPAIFGAGGSEFGFGQGGGGGDWASFGPTSYAGMDAPNPTFTDVAGPNPGVTTGPGDFGSAGAYSAAGTGGGPGGAMFGAAQAAAQAAASGGLFGDYSGGGGGYTGGGGGGRGGGGAFGSFGGPIGNVGASNTGRGSEAPSAAGFTDTVGGGRGSADAPAGRSDAPTRGEAEVASVSADDLSAAPDADTPAPDADTTAPAAALGGPSKGDESAPSEAAPSPSEEATPSTATPGRDAAPETEAAPNAFGPQSLSYDYQGSPYADMGPPSQAYDYQGSPYAELGPQAEPGLTDPTALGMPNISASQWGSVFNAMPAWAQNAPNFSALANPSTWLAPQNRGVIEYLSNLPDLLSQPYGAYTMDQQALGEQGRAGQMTDLATQLGAETIGAPQGLDPGSEQYGTEAYAPGGIDPGAAQYATASDPATQLGTQNIAPVDWGSVFEGAAAVPNTYDPAADQAAYDFGGLGQPYGQTDFGGWADTPADTTMESGQPVAATTTDTTDTPGGDPALSGASVDAATAAAAAAAAGVSGASVPGAPGAPGTSPAGGVVDPGVSPDAIANAASNAAQDVGANPAAGDAASQAAANAARAGESLANVVAAARNAALANEATQEQADAIANAVHAAAVSQAENEVGTVPGAAPAPSITSTIPGGRTTDFNYPTSSTPPQAQPGLADMGGQPGTSVTIPGGRTTDFTYPSSTSRGIDPGIGHGVEVEADDDDHDAPEPGDSSLPAGHDPNAPRPPGNIPGQLRGANGQYDNNHADTPQGSRTYSNSGRTDYPQGRPGVDFRTARQAGIEPLFRTQDINVEDTDARLVENINRALRAMEQRTGIPANSLVATSAYRAAHRGEALEHLMDQRTSQESVYSRGHPTSGRGFPSAPPGRSNHGHGRAIDFAQSRAREWLRQNAREFGLETLGRNYDVPHIQLSGAGRNVNARPSAQEQAEQRALDAQNRQAAIDRGLIAPGRGQAPVQQAAVPVPRGRPTGIDTGIQPGAEQYSGTPLAPQPPTVNLPPPQETPLDAPRPPADIPINIPVQTVPPRAGRADPAMLDRAIKEIAARAIEGISPQSTREQAAAKGAAGRAALQAAGVPAPMARAAMMDTATKTAIAMGYGPNYTVLGINMWSTVQGKIAEAVDQAMQGYTPAKPGAVQGPPAPADLVAPVAPGKRSEAPFGSFVIPVAGGRDVGAPPAVEPGQQPGRAEWEAPLPGGMGRNLDVLDLLGPRDPRSDAVFDPNRGVGRTPVIDPDLFQFSPTRGLAKGGRAAEDEPVVVGEEGPEVFVPDRPGTVVPHMPQPGGPGRSDRYWPKMPAVDYPGRYGDVEREIRRQTRAAQDPSPGLMEMIDSGRLRLNAANWQRMINDPALIALGRSRIEDQTTGDFIPGPEPAVMPPDPTNPMAQALGYGSIARPPPRPLRIGRQSY